MIRRFLGSAGRAWIAAAVCLACGTFAAAAFAAGADSTAGDAGLPQPMVHRLDNGVRLAVFPDHRLPIVQMELLVPVGSGEDPPDGAGLAHLVAEMLTQGTSSRSAEVFESTLGRLAGNIVSSVSRDYTTVDARFLAEDFEAGLELMSDAVLNPTFGDAELQRVKAATFATRSQVLQNPSVLAEERVWAATLEDGPYARSPYGTAESLASLTADRLRSFYYQHFLPEGAILAIAGDVTPERALAAAREWFGRWPERTSAKVESLAVAAPAGDRMKIRLVDVPGLGRTWLRIALPAPSRGSPDEAAFALANAAFGSGATSRLGELRESGALREGGSFYLPLRQAGLFGCSAVASNDSVLAVLRLLRGELQRWVTQPPDDQELDPVRRLLHNVHPMQFETLGGVVSFWCVASFYGDAKGARDRYDSIGAADVAGAIRRWVRPEGLTVVAVGPAAAIRSQLESLGPVAMVETVFGEPMSAEEPPTPEQLARGREVVKLAVAAHGGLSRFKRIKDSTLEADLTLEMKDQQLQGDFVQIRKDPYKMVYTTSLAGLDVQQVLNGRRAWSSAGAVTQQVHDLDSVATAGMRSGFDADLPHLLLAASDPEARLVSRGRQKIGAVETDAVEVTTQERRRKLFFDAKTHLLLAMDQHESRVGGRLFSARRLYRDYRNVDGIQWPFVEERLLDGQRIMLINARSVRLNSGVDDSIFEHPEAPLPPPVR